MSTKDHDDGFVTRLRDIIVGALDPEGTVDIKERTRIAAVIRRELEAPHFDEAERAAASTTGVTDDPRELDALIGARVRRALKEGLSVAASDVGLDRQPPVPSVRVVRAASDLEASAVADELKQALSNGTGRETVEGAVNGAHVLPAILMTDRPTYQALRKAIGRAAFRRLHGESNGAPAASNVPHVLEAEDELGSLTAIVRKALDEVDLARAASIPDGRDEEDDLTGQVLGGKYRIVSLKGKGGFGTVYEGVDIRLGAKVAVKVLNKRAASSPRAMAEFLEEAKRLTTLDHENIVRWITFDSTPDDLHYFVMELLAGEELDKLLAREGKLDADRTANILLQTLAALTTAHEGDTGCLLHLDLKPANVFIQDGDPEKVKVIDFGIGQHVGAEAISDDHKVGPGMLAGLDADLERSIATMPSTIGNSMGVASTVKRARGGTVLYASPEQCTHLMGYDDIPELDSRSDLYSLGVMAFKMLTGKFPFDSCKSADEGFNNHLKVPPHKVGSMGVKVPRKLAAFVDRCLAKKPDDRWRDAREAYEAMYDIVHPRAYRRLAIMAAALVLLATALVWQLMSESTAAAPFDLLFDANGSVVSVLREPVYLGPDRPSVAFEAVGMEPSWKNAEVRLAAAPGPGSGLAMAPDSAEAGASLTGWSVEWTDEGLQLDAPDEVTELPDQVVVEFQPGSGPARFSNPINLVYLGPDAWSLGRLRVPDLGLRDLDPDRASLQIPITGREEDLEQVEVLVGDRAQRVVRPPDSPSEGSLVYEQPLDGLELPDGPSTLVVRVTDRAGGVREAQLDLNVVNGPLRGESLRLTGCTDTGTEWAVAPNSEAVLELTLNREAALRWGLFDDSQPDMPFQGGIAEPAKTHRLPLPFNRYAEERSLDRFEGRLVLTLDDAQLVAHAMNARFSGTLELPEVRFAYSSELPELGLAITSADGGAGPVLDGDGTGMHYLRLDGARLSIERRNLSLPVRYEVLCGPAGSEPGLAIERKLLRREPRVDVELPLQDDGAYELLVRAWRHDADTGHDIGSPIVRGPFTLLIDRSAPRLSLVTQSSPIVFRDLAATPEDWRVEIADAALPGGVETPVTLQWRFLGLDGQHARGSSVGWNDLPGTALPSSGAALVLPPVSRLVQSVSALDVDGTYQLQVRGVDAAGNQAETVEQPVVISASAPRLRNLVRPSVNLPWNRSGESGSWEVEVEAEDANGTEWVACKLVLVDDPERWLDVPLQERGAGRAGDADQAMDGDEGGDEPAVRLVRAPSRASLWAGGVDLDHTWSGRDVLLEFRARDLQGTEGTPGDPYHLTLGAIERDMPRRIAITGDGRLASPMSRVEGNTDREYVFHGRGDELEQDDFSSARLGNYKAARGNRKSWQVLYRPEEIPNFYLDEREVTEAEFLAFLRAPDGARSASNWPATSSSAARLDALEERLASSVQEAADLPVTNVSFDEAAAYAQWAGKRLQSFTEWEYAVRDGPSYRLYASFQDGARPPGPEQLNHAQRSDSAGPWPVDQGGDVCPQRGLRNLCSNVSEWTSSPTAYVEPGASPPRNIPAHMRTHGPGLLAGETGAGATEYWVAGGSYLSRAFDFSVVESQSRDQPSRTIGFRCALSEQAVISLMEHPRRGGHRIESLEGQP